MPVYDTPINTDDAGFPRLLSAGLPVLLYLYERPDAALDEALQRTAKAHAGDLLVARVAAPAAPQTLARAGRPALPALAMLTGGDLLATHALHAPADVERSAEVALGRRAPAPAEPPRPANAVPLHISDATFDRDVLGSALPVLVDFWAPWCGPCRQIAPALDALAARYAGRVTIAKLNVDDNPRTAQAFRVLGIPMLLLFKGGKVAGKLMGAQPAANLERLIQQAL